MKKILLMLCMVVAIIGCSIQGRYPDGFSYDLPFNLKYYLSKDQSVAMLDSLVRIDILKNDGSLSYDYDLFLSDGTSIELSVTPRFYNDSLYFIDIRERYPNDESEKINYKNAIEFFKAQEINLNSYNRTYDKIFHEYTWNKPAFEITLYPDNSLLIIIFEDGLISDRLDRMDSDQNMKETRQRIERNDSGVKVENSSWNGSVFQVEKYLKKNLKDLESYESMEWGEVIETNNGYAVRHKYRAKNSLGGYIVENQIFYLDYEGKVINVE